MTGYLCNFIVLTLLHGSASRFLYHHYNHLSELDSFTSEKEHSVRLSHNPVLFTMADIYMDIRFSKNCGVKITKTESVRLLSHEHAQVG